MMLQEKRSTRGQRMTALVGKAQEEDDAFWGGESAWRELEEGSDAESFRSDDEQQQPDEFDSDFNDTETDDSDDEDGSAAAAAAAGGGGARGRAAAVKAKAKKAAAKDDESGKVLLQSC